MTDPTRYDAVNDQLVECVRGAAVKYKDWKATDEALKAKIDALRLGQQDILMLRVSPEYERADAVRMAQAIQCMTNNSVVVLSVDIELTALSPELSEDETDAIYENATADGWCAHDMTEKALRAIFRRVMAMRTSP